MLINLTEQELSLLLDLLEKIDQKDKDKYKVASPLFEKLKRLSDLLNGQLELK